MPTYAPCRNPNCSHKGQAHPNCHCYRGVSTQRLDRAGLTRPGVTTNQPIGSIQGYAEGGDVSYCEGPHQQNCQYYMAEGGQISVQPSPESPSEDLGHAAINGGLTSLLQNTGRTELTDFKAKHHKKLDQLRRNKDSDLSGPLTGKISKESLTPIIDKLHGVVNTKDTDPAAFRGAVNYLHGVGKGQNRLKDYTEGMLGLKGELKVRPDETSRERLKNHISDLALSPEKALETGGRLGHYLPEHATQLGALTAQATNYLNSIKPTNTSTGAFNAPVLPSKVQQEQYHRQVDIAEQPLMVMEHVKNGRLIPQDITTLTALYPQLYQKMAGNIQEALVESQTKGKEIPYQRKMALSMFLNQPLDATMTQGSIQAAIQANAPKTPPVPPEGKKPSKPTMAQMVKQDDMYATNTQDRDSKKSD